MEAWCKMEAVNVISLALRWRLKVSRLDFAKAKTTTWVANTAGGNSGGIISRSDFYANLYETAEICGCVDD